MTGAAGAPGVFGLFRNDRMQSAAMSFRAELPVGMGGKGFRLIETLSREISGRHAAHTIENGDFFTPLRSGRNDRGTTARCMPPHPLLFKETDDEALDKNTYEIRFCELISTSLVCNNICPNDAMYRDPSLRSG